MERRKLTKQDIDNVRNIEGFPNGTDEDIIALSDAPYYTACPNPFIEEFIAENGYSNDPCSLYKISNVSTLTCHCLTPELSVVSDKQLDTIHNGIVLPCAVRLPAEKTARYTQTHFPRFFVR